MKTLHALIVAIDKYPVKGHELNGCVNDASAFAAYLKEFCRTSNITYSEKRLFDADAARLKIVEGFKHFDAAKDGDTCVYYYSGHGSQMKAPPEFWDEPDGMSQTIVCHDSRTGGAGCRDMADKEIGYLIHKATKGRDVHFLAVTDCCHSGTNTREVAAAEGLKARMADTCTSTPRAIDYQGFKEWNNFQPPSSKHVHLAAAKNDETAKECKINGTSRGVFTFSMIETLQQTNGNISYMELMQRVSIKAKNKVQDQTPQLNAYGNTNTKDIRLSFLGETERQGGTYLVTYNNTENSWIVNAGGVQGLPTEGGTEFQLENGMKATTSQVLSNFSKIDLQLPPTDTIFSAKLTSAIRMASRPVRLAISKDSDPSGAKTMAAAFAKEGIPNLQLVDNERDTDYVIRAWDGAYRLTTIDSTTPLFKRVNELTADSASEFLSRCLTVAEWQNRLGISNPATSIKESDIDIVFYDGTGKALDPSVLDANGKAKLDTMPVFRQPNKDKEAECQVSIENKSGRTLWVSSVYFGSDFSISNQFLRQKQVNAGEKVWMEFDNSKNIPLFVPHEYLTWGVNELSEYFKIFVSTDKLDTDIHNQDGLPLDTKDVGTNRAVRKGVVMQDWRTFDRPFRTISPMAGTVLAANTPKKFNDVEITAPTGFSGKVNLSSTTEAKRALGDQVLPQMRGNALLENAAFAEGMGISAPLDVLELSGVTGSVSKENPLTIKFLNNLPDDEILLPLGYDAESGLYVLLGTSNTEGVLSIDTLPSPSPATERLAGSSFKIFLRKMIMKPLTGDFDYPLLQAVDYGTEPELFVYSEDQHENLTKRVANAKKIVLFIHGFAGSTSELPKALRRNLTKTGKNLASSYDLTLTFNYESINTTIEQNAEFLEAKLAEVGLKAGHGKQFHIVAHSMGGLVSRWFIECLSGRNVVTQLIMLGTPNKGSSIPALHEKIKLIITMMVNGVPFLRPWATPISWLGKAVDTALVTVKQQVPDSPFFKALNSSPDVGVPYRIVMGNTQLLMTPKKDVDGTFRKVIEHFRSRKIFAVSDSFFGEPNDVIVPNSSTGSAGLQKNVKIEVIASTHFSYFVPESDSLKTLATFVNEGLV
jgi:pimeloyl-ACP methyl ester carboxylesterase